MIGKVVLKVHVFYPWAYLLLFLAVPAQIIVFQFCVSNSATPQPNQIKSSFIINYSNQFQFDSCRLNNPTNERRWIKIRQNHPG